MRAILDPDGTGLAGLFKQLKADAVHLVRSEIELAKVELKSNVRSLARNAVAVAAGGVVILLGAIALTGAASVGAAALLAIWLPMAVAAWLGPLIVGVVMALAGYIVLRRGLARIELDRLEPTVTKQTLEDDARWLRRKIS